MRRSRRSGIRKSIGTDIRTDIKRKISAKIKNNVKDDKLFWIVLGFMLIGIIIGVLLVVTMNPSRQRYLYVFIGNYFNMDTVRSEIFRESVVKYGKFVVIMWLLAFIPVGFGFNLITLMLRGTSLGFTVAFLIASFGLRGIYFTVILFLVQNIILIPAYIFVSHQSLKFCFSNMKMHFYEYCLCLLIGLAACVLAALVESYLLRIVIGMNINF